MSARGSSPAPKEGAEVERATEAQGEKRTTEEVTYIAAADFRLGTLKPYTSGLALTEADGTDAYLDLIIA